MMLVRGVVGTEKGEQGKSSRDPLELTPLGIATRADRLIDGASHCSIGGLAMGSVRRWRVIYFDRGRRISKADVVAAEGEPEQILARLSERYPGRRFQSIEPVPDKVPESLG